MTRKQIRKPNQQKGKVIARLAHKGGVGKTTSCAVEGMLAAATGKRVLLIDLDSQRNLSDRFGCIEGTKDIAEVFPRLRHPSVPKAILEQIHVIKIAGKANTIDIIQGVHNLDDFLEYATKEINDDRADHHFLARAVDICRYYYDEIYIDTAPGLDNFVLQLVMYASDFIATPVVGWPCMPGLFNLLDRVGGHNDTRCHEGLPPLQTYIYCPRLVPDPSGDTVLQDLDVVPNGSWYPFLRNLFPQHFIKKCVQQSKTMQDTEGVGMTLRELRNDTRKDWVAMAAEMRKVRDNAELQILTDYIKNRPGFMARARKQIVTLRDKGTRYVQVLEPVFKPLDRD